jgi:hypothetical protein
MGEEEKDLDNRGHSRRHSGAQAIRLTGMRSIEQARMPVFILGGCWRQAPAARRVRALLSHFSAHVSRGVKAKDQAGESKKPKK